MNILYSALMMMMMMMMMMTMMICYQEGLELNETHHFLVSYDVNMLV
jgi:hypothetical protein